MNKALLEQSMLIAEEFFGTVNDPDQIPITMESAEKLWRLHPDGIVFRTDESGKLIGWVVLFPTTRALMEKFLSREITERELLDLTPPGADFDAIYLCAAVVVPEHRKQGIATELWKEAIAKVSGGKKMELFGWAYSEEGRKMGEKLARDLGVVIRSRLPEPPGMLPWLGRFFPYPWPASLWFTWAVMTAVYVSLQLAVAAKPFWYEKLTYAVGLFAPIAPLNLLWALRAFGPGMFIFMFVILLTALVTGDKFLKRKQMRGAKKVFANLALLLVLTYLMDVMLFGTWASWEVLVGEGIRF